MVYKALFHFHDVDSRSVYALTVRVYPDYGRSRAKRPKVSGWRVNGTRSGFSAETGDIPAVAPPSEWFSARRDPTEDKAARMWVTAPGRPPIRTASQISPEEYDRLLAEYQARYRGRQPAPWGFE
jgi:hypothetical protein